MYRRARVHRPNDPLELREDARRLGRVGAHDGDGADPLACCCCARTRWCGGGGEGWDRLTPLATTTSRHVSPYSPKFLAKDCARTSECPASAKRRIDAESASASPEAKPCCDGGVGGARSRRGDAAVGVVGTREFLLVWRPNLVRTVHQYVVPSGEDGVRDLPPLIRARVDARRVVRAPAPEIPPRYRRDRVRSTERRSPSASRAHLRETADRDLSARSQRISAHACSRKIEPGGAALMSPSMPSMSSVFVERSRYL